MSEVKTYSIAVFNINDNIASGETYLVDKKARKIWMFRMCHPAKDVTATVQKKYFTDIHKEWKYRRISGELYKLMDNQDDTLGFLKVIEHSDSAKEITERIYDVRALQAELQLKVCRNHLHWSTEETAAEHFGSL